MQPLRSWACDQNTPLWAESRFHKILFRLPVASFPSAMSTTTQVASKLTLLNRLSCAIFGSVYNPQRIRTGNKILRQRLVGPTINSYYPNVQRIALHEITRMVPEMKLIDQGEKARLDGLAERRKRGKGPPKKGTCATGFFSSWSLNVLL